LKVLIELPSWLGDTVMLTPAIENIVEASKNVRLYLISYGSIGDLFIEHPNVEFVIKTKKNIRNSLSLIKELNLSFDIFLSFRSSYRSTILKFFVPAKKKYQYSKRKYSFGHQVEKYNKFVNDALETSFPAGNLKIYSSSIILKNSKSVLGINPGSAYGEAKCWPPDKFSKLAISLAEKFDIVIFGGKNDIPRANLIEKKITKKGVKNLKNLAGKTTINDLVNGISNLDLFITGDSGPMHIAAAFHIPTISIFGPTKSDETSPWMNPNSLIMKRDLECQPCMKRTCPLGHHQCMNEIKSQEVVKKSISLLRNAN